MANTPPEPLSQYLESLRAAGIEWLPRQAGVEFSQPEPVVVVPPVSVTLPLVPETPRPAMQETPAEMSPQDRLAELEALARLVSRCSRCPVLASTRTQTVFGVGPLDADLAFVGEAPGADEDAQGEPFVGAAGQLLDRIIVASGLRREDVFILNILRCRPPGNRTPTPEEAENCREYLERTIELVKPKIICALGGTAAKSLLGVETGIMRLRGRWTQYRGIPVMPTLHPSYLLRMPAAKKEVWEDMKAILTRMGRPIPGKSG